MSKRNSVRTIFHAMCLTGLGMLPASAHADNPMVIREVKRDFSRPLRDMAVPAQANNGGQLTGPVARPTRGPLTSAQPDPLAHVPAEPPVGITTLLNFDGVDDPSQASQSGFLVVPPDTNGAVGATQFLQWVNLAFAVFDKKTGAMTYN